MKNGNIYKFSFPLLRTHLGVPLGNGGFGVLVWGKEGQLNITVSRNDFWDHRIGRVKMVLTCKKKLLTGKKPIVLKLALLTNILSACIIFSINDYANI